MNRHSGASLCAVTALLLTGAQAQKPKPAAPPLLHMTFEHDAEGWTTYGKDVKISNAHEDENVKQGKGALQFDYKVSKGELGALVLPIKEKSLAKMRSLHFWVKTDYATPVLVALQEKDGGRYLTLFTPTKYEWQEVTLTPDDFYLTADKGDPKDPDGKLDMDQIDSITIADAGQLLAQSDDANLAKLFNVKLGAHSLYLDDFSAREEAAPAPAALDKNETAIDQFANPQVSWMGLGDVAMTRATGKPLDGASMQASYKQAPDKFVGFIRRFARGAMTSAKELRFDVASTKPARLLVQVEESDGGKYNTIVDVPGDSTHKEVSIAFSNLTQADDSHDTNLKLDNDLIQQIVIIDVSGPVDQTVGQNTLWLNRIRVASAK